MASPSDSDSKVLGFIADLFRFLESGRVSLQPVLDYLTKQIGADRGILVTCSESTNQIRILAGSNLKDPNLTLEEYQISRTVFREVIRFRQAVLIQNPLEDQAYSAQSSIVKPQVRSILAVPITGQNEVIAILYFDTQRLQRSFGESDRACLEQVAPLIKTLFLARPAAEPETLKEDEFFLDHDKALQGLIGSDPAFLKSISLLKKVAPTPATVLLTGESGTGKELFARAIHAMSPRKNSAFVPINCAAIPDTLLESELFGYEKGAFTGADNTRAGKVERANHGTVFLDEIGELKPELQAKLLRFLQSGEIERVGAGAPLRVDARVVAATNQDLAGSVKEGTFRQDLFFRLNVFPIALPALRERKADLRELAEHFFKKYAKLLNLRAVKVDAAVYEAIECYAFPGNVRELENLAYRSLLLSQGGTVTVEDLPPEVSAASIRAMEKDPFSHLRRVPPNTYQELGQRKEAIKKICRDEISYLERRFAEALVSAAGGNVSKAAETAGIDRGLFYRLLKPGE